MYHSFLIHKSASGHLGCFHVLDIINSAVMNIGVHVSLSILVSFFKKINFIHFWLCWVFVAGISLVVVSGLLLCSSGSGARGLGSCGSQVLERRLNSCGPWG